MRFDIETMRGIEGLFYDPNTWQDYFANPVAPPERRRVTRLKNIMAGLTWD